MTRHNNNVPVVSEQIVISKYITGFVKKKTNSDLMHRNVKQTNKNNMLTILRSELDSLSVNQGFEAFWAPL